MPGLPDDLRPIQTQPWAERPAELPLDVEECRTALWRCNGNISRAAEMLKTPSARLRNFVKRSEYLSREVAEASEELVDSAEEVARAALGDPDRADQMARFILSTKGRARGWGTGQGPSVSVQNNGPLVIKWGDGSTVAIGQADEPTTIDGEVVE